MMPKLSWTEEILTNTINPSSISWVKLLPSLFMPAKSTKIKTCGSSCLTLRTFNKLLEDCGIYTYKEWVHVRHSILSLWNNSVLTRRGRSGNLPSSKLFQGNNLFLFLFPVTLDVARGLILVFDKKNIYKSDFFKLLKKIDIFLDWKSKNWDIFQLFLI